MPRLCLLKPRGSDILPWASFTGGLGEPAIERGESTPDGAHLLAFLEAGLSPSDLASPVTLLVPPEAPLHWLDAFAHERHADRVRRMVLHTPMHHLYALERLRFPAGKLELIPWAVEPVGVSATPREEGLLVELVFAGCEHNAAERSGLARRARVERCAPGDAAARAQLLARASLVVVAVGAQATGAGTRELLQAMAHGAPIIATRTWGLEHLLVPEVEGVLVQVGDLAALLREAERLLGNTEEALAMGRRAAAKHRTTLTAAHYLARLRRIAAHADDDPSPEFFLVAAHSHATVEAAR